uniref:Deacetylase sirtuin-type domain-containing protein n=1 Tax=Macrostomum lignano TaxID=282301 RepID=A0A1I8FEP9_9PLAT
RRPAQHDGLCRLGADTVTACEAFQPLADSSPWRRAPGADACPGLSAPLELQLSQLMPGQDFQLLSEPFEVRRFPFGPPDCLANLPESGDDVISVSVPWLESGLETADDAELTVTAAVSSARSRPGQRLAEWPSSASTGCSRCTSSRRSGASTGDQRDSLKLLHWHDGYSNYFDLLPDSAASPAPSAARFCSCGIHQTVNRARLAETQDPSYSSGHVDWIKSVLELCPTDRALATVGDLCILPHLLASAAIDRQPLLCVEPRRRCREAVIESNQLLLSSGRIVAELPKLAELMDGGYAEPSFASSLLPWDDLRFSGTWLRPAAQQPRAPPIRPDGCEGFDLSEFDRLAEPAAEATWSRLESQPFVQAAGGVLMLTPGRGSSPIAKDRRRLALTAKYELDSAELAVSVAP